MRGAAAICSVKHHARHYGCCRWPVLALHLFVSRSCCAWMLLTHAHVPRLVVPIVMLCGVRRCAMARGVRTTKHYACWCTAGLFIPLGEIKAARRAALARFCASLQHHASATGLAQQAVLPELLAATRGEPDKDVQTLGTGQGEKRGNVQTLAAGSGALAGVSQALSATERHAGGGVAAARVVGEQPLLRVLCRSRAQVCTCPYASAAQLVLL